VHKVWVVVRREFIERVRTKWFWIGTILGPLLMIGLIGLQILLASRGAGDRTIAVVDGTTGGFGQRLTGQLGTAIPRFHLTRIAAAPGVADSLFQAVVDQRLDGYLLVSDSTLEQGVAEYRGSNVSSIADMEQLEGSLRRLVFAARLEREGIDTAVVQRAEIRVRLATNRISGRKLTGQSGAQSFMTGFGMAILLFVAILMYGVNVMGSVLEEKTTRVVEVLVSSLRPFQLMVGKVLGAGAVGLVQLTVWLGSAKLLSQQRFAGAEAAAPGTGFQFPEIPALTLVIFVVYFLLGYFLYAAIYAAVGSMSSTEAEARQAQVPVQLVLMIPYISFFSLLNDPNSSLAVWYTMIPFWSPIATPVRWGATPIPVLELVASIVILTVTVILVMWIASRIYRVGILMTGKRPSVKELVRWVRAA